MKTRAQGQAADKHRFLDICTTNSWRQARPVPARFRMEASPKLQKAGRRFLMRLMAENGLEAAVAILRDWPTNSTRWLALIERMIPLAILSGQNGRAELDASIVLGLSRTENAARRDSCAHGGSWVPAPTIAADVPCDAAPRGLPRPVQRNHLLCQVDSNGSNVTQGASLF